MSAGVDATWEPGAMVAGTSYRLVRKLGEGGMGDVYEAEHVLLGAPRALKMLKRQMEGRGDLAARLRTEARALAALAHPNLVQVHDLGVSSDGRMFFAMELLDGATVRDLLARSGRIDAPLAVAIASRVLAGLAAAHGRGLVHRDIKPENVFVTTRGEVKVLDFGIVKAEDVGVTGSGMTVGTPRYMAPEQSLGRSVDARTDVYGVGILLWEMLAGRSPFSSSAAAAALVDSVTEGVPSLATMKAHGVHVEDALAAIVARACALAPSDRHPGAEALRAELETLGTEASPEALAELALRGDGGASVRAADDAHARTEPAHAMRTEALPAEPETPGRRSSPDAPTPTSAQAARAAPPRVVGDPARVRVTPPPQAPARVAPTLVVAGAAVVLVGALAFALRPEPHRAAVTADSTPSAPVRAPARVVSGVAPGDRAEPSASAPVPAAPPASSTTAAAPVAVAESSAPATLRPPMPRGDRSPAAPKPTAARPAVDPLLDQK